MKLLSKERENRMGKLQRKTRSHHAPAVTHYSGGGYTGSDGGTSVYQEATGGDVITRKVPSRKESMSKKTSNPFADNETTPRRKQGPKEPQKRGKTAPPNMD